jgi:hypothetical protein
VSPEIQSPSYFTSQGITLQKFPEVVLNSSFSKIITTINVKVLGSGNKRDDLQHVVTADVMLSPGMTSLSIISVGRGRIPFHGPTLWKSTRPRQGKSRVLKDIT